LRQRYNAVMLHGGLPDDSTDWRTTYLDYLATPSGLYLPWVKN